ncbi:MAG: methionine synthase [Aeromicrobium sp.]
MSFGAGVGSMPGDDYAEALRVVIDTTPDLVSIPELPARGVQAAMTGRGMGILAELGADLQPAGWRLTGAGSGTDQRRARSMLSQDLDAVEEKLQGFDGILKVQVMGPWTLSATVERPRGDRVLADHGARRDLAQSLAEGIRQHLASVSARVPGASLILQVDEPALTAVLNAQIPTASGWGRHRSIDKPEADAALRSVAEAGRDSGARTVLHSCGPDVPVDLAAGAGFDALNFDLSLAEPGDAWASAFDRGIDLWPGVVPSMDADGVSDRVLGKRVRDFFNALGFGVDAYAERLVVTPTCGLAGASPAWAKRALRIAQAVGTQR